MEGIVLRVNAIIDLIKMTCKTGTSEWNNSCIIASGNALEHNETWRSMLADCSGLPVVLDNDTSEGTSRGVVIMIAEALKSKSDILPMEELGECIETQTCSESSLYWTKKKQNQDAMITAISSTWNTSK
jgi:sugar (pentulose or hexulose) kinase